MMQHNNHSIFLVWNPSSAIKGMIHEYAFDTFVPLIYAVFSLKIIVSCR